MDWAPKRPVPVFPLPGVVLFPNGEMTLRVFELLFDADALVSKAYGVWKQKNLYGKKFLGIERTTFVIDRTGRIAQIYPKVKVEGHVAEVLAFLTED